MLLKLRFRVNSNPTLSAMLSIAEPADIKITKKVLEVDPAYTSTLGAVNYAARFGISIHQGAAMAIARRSLGLSERPAVRVARVPTRRGGHVTVPLPVRNRGGHVWSFRSKVSRQIRAALRAHVPLLPGFARDSATVARRGISRRQDGALRSGRLSSPEVSQAVVSFRRVPGEFSQHDFGEVEV
jgi:hypothetical protein